MRLHEDQVRPLGVSSPDVAAFVTGWSAGDRNSCELRFDEVDGSLHGGRLKSSHSAAVRAVEEDQ